METKMAVRVVKKRQEPEELSPVKQFERMEEIRREAKVAARLRKPQEFVALSDKIAKSTIKHRNLYIQELRVAFAVEDRMKRVDEMFPYAEGGALYVDFAATSKEYDSLLARKKPVMDKAGYRYMVLFRDGDYNMIMSEMESAKHKRA